MALFKISKGQSENLSKQQLTEGYAWFTPDDGKFYIDAKPSSSSAVQRIPLNAHLADNLRTPVKISLTTGALGNTNFDGSKDVQISVTSLKEAYLDWGGRNLTGEYSALDAALVPTLGANRFAFMPAAGVTIEYSRDGGSTWTNYGASDQMKVQLFDGEGTNLRIGADNSQTGVDKSKYQVRVTIDSVAAKIYTQLKKFVIDISTEGSTGAWVTIDGKTRTDVVAGTDTWTTFTNKQDISGQSAFNIINVSGITTYSNNNSQYQKLRFTFGVTSHASTIKNPGLTVRGIYGYGGMGWTVPSNLAGRGTIYTHDYQQNVFFPNKIQVEGLTIHSGVGIQATAPTDPTHLVNKKYVDDKAGTFYITLDVDTDPMTADHTNAEIKAAYDAGKTIYVKFGFILTPVTLPLVSCTSSQAIFMGIGYSESQVGVMTVNCTNDVWTITQQNVVPTTRKINNKSLSSDITLTASDVGALGDDYKPVWIITGDYNLATNAISNIDKTYTNIKAAIDSGYQVQLRLNIAGMGVLSLPYITTAFDNHISFEGDVIISDIITHAFVIVDESNIWESHIYNALTRYSQNSYYSAGDCRISQLAPPEYTTDATNKQYVDTAISGISIPVTSVNSKTGAVELTASDVGALPLTGGTLTGNLKIGSSNIGTNGYIEGTWLKTTAVVNKGSGTGKVAVIDGAGLIYYRTPKEILEEAGGGGGLAKRYTVTCTANQTSISFPTTFPDLDSIAVYHNGLLLTPTINYSINTNGTGIDLVGYSAEEGDLITFVATVEASDFTDEKVIKGEVTTTAGQTVINIPFTIVSTTGLAVYENGILISEGNQYSATTTAITLLGYTANSGDIYTFVSDRALAGLSLTPNAATTTLSSTAFSGITNVKDALEQCLPLSGGNMTGTINFANNFSMTDKNNNRIAVVENNNVLTGFGIFGAQTAVISTANASNGIIVNNSRTLLVGDTVVSGVTADPEVAVVRNIMYSTSVPTSSQGEDGDICIVYTP